MPTINITDDATLNLTASAPGVTSTLSRYLKNALHLQAPRSFGAIAPKLVREQHQENFPINLSGTGGDKFGVGNTTLSIQAGACAAVGLLQGDKETDFLSCVDLHTNPAGSGLVSFALQTTLSAGNSATVSDFTFGISDKASVTLTSYYAAADGDLFEGAVIRAAEALTIPHDIDDLKSIPAGAISRFEGTSCLRFTASATYSFLNDPLAAVAIGKLPSFSLTATASATLEGAVSHTSGHILTIARLSNGLLRLAVNLTKTDDFETSLTVSAGIGDTIAGQDPLAFLLGKMNPDAEKDAGAIAAQMKDAAQFRSDIKTAIENALCKSLGASLKAALDNKTTPNRVLVCEIDLNGLDAQSEAALQSALAGDFTALTAPGASFRGVQTLDSVLTVTAAQTHTLVLHFLGIFNASSINQFVSKSKVDFTKDTHEIVLSDESIQVVDNNLTVDKLRKLVLKDITLTLPASANSPGAAAPITLAFLDREANTSPSKMRQFVNVLQAVQAPGAAGAQALLDSKLGHYGACSVFLSLALDSAACRQLFIGSNQQARDFAFYIGAICAAEKTILAGLEEDSVSGYRLKLFNANLPVWLALQNAADQPNMIPILEGLGLSDTEAKFAVTDAMTSVWWAATMAAYATALDHGQPLEAIGKKLVEDSTRGYNEPWMTLAAWNMAGKPSGVIKADFASSLPAPAIAAR